MINEDMLHFNSVDSLSCVPACVGVHTCCCFCRSAAQQTEQGVRYDKIIQCLKRVISMENSACLAESITSNGLFENSERELKCYHDMFHKEQHDP